MSTFIKSHNGEFTVLEQKNGQNVTNKRPFIKCKTINIVCTKEILVCKAHVDDIFLLICKSHLGITAFFNFLFFFLAVTIPMIYTAFINQLSNVMSSSKWEQKVMIAV